MNRSSKTIENLPDDQEHLIRYEIRHFLASLEQSKNAIELTSNEETEFWKLKRSSLSNSPYTESSFSSSIANYNWEVLWSYWISRIRSLPRERLLSRALISSVIKNCCPSYYRRGTNKPGLRDSDLLGSIKKALKELACMSFLRVTEVPGIGKAAISGAVSCYWTRKRIQTPSEVIETEQIMSSQKLAKWWTKIGHESHLLWPCTWIPKIKLSISKVIYRTVSIAEPREIFAPCHQAYGMSLILVHTTRPGLFIPARMMTCYPTNDWGLQLSRNCFFLIIWLSLNWWLL